MKDGTRTDVRRTVVKVVPNRGSVFQRLRHFFEACLSFRSVSIFLEDTYALDHNPSDFAVSLFSLLALDRIYCSSG
jgi:hypothetical protein